MSRRIVSDGCGRNLLDLGQPRRIDALRFAVGDARRQVAIADHHRARLQPRRDARPELESIGDVEQLQRVGLIVALTLQGAADLVADVGRVFGKRQELGVRGRRRETHRAAVPPASACRFDRGLRRRSDDLWLGACGLGPECSFSLERQQFVERLAAANDAPLLAVDQHFRRQRPAQIGVSHHRAVGADVANDHDVADFDRRKLSIARIGVGALADRTDDVDRDVRRRRGESAARCGDTRCRARAASARSCRHRAR